MGYPATSYDSPSSTTLLFNCIYIYSILIPKGGGTGSLPLISDRTRWEGSIVFIFYLR